MLKYFIFLCIFITSFTYKTTAYQRPPQNFQTLIPATQARINAIRALNRRVAQIRYDYENKPFFQDYESQVGSLEKNARSLAKDIQHLESMLDRCTRTNSNDTAFALIRQIRCRTKALNSCLAKAKELNNSLLFEKAQITNLLRF